MQEGWLPKGQLNLEMQEFTTGAQQTEDIKFQLSKNLKKAICFSEEMGGVAM